MSFDVLLHVVVASLLAIPGIFCGIICCEGETAASLSETTCDHTCGPEINQVLESGQNVTHEVHNCFIAWKKAANQSAGAPTMVRGCLTITGRDNAIHFKPEYNYNCSINFTSVYSIDCQTQCFNYENKFQNLVYRTCYCSHPKCNSDFSSAEIDDNQTNLKLPSKNNRSSSNTVDRIRFLIQSAAVMLLLFAMLT